MKKILLAGILLMQIMATNAQDDFRSFRFGLKAEPNIGWFKPDAAGFGSKGARLNFTYGLMLEFGLGNNYSFKSGLDVLTLGGTLTFPDSTSYFVDNAVGDSTKRFFLYERTYKIQYVDIPLQLKMKTNEIGYLTYFGQFGFNLGFRTRADAVSDKGKYLLAGQAEQAKHKINDDTGLFRIALNIGAGVEYNLAGKTSLVFGVNYVNGFTNALKKRSDRLFTPTGGSLEQKALAKYISLTVGILF